MRIQKSNSSISGEVVSINVVRDKEHFLILDDETGFFWSVPFDEARIVRSTKIE